MQRKIEEKDLPKVSAVLKLPMCKLVASLKALEIWIAINQRLNLEKARHHQRQIDSKGSIYDNETL